MAPRKSTAPKLQVTLVEDTLANTLNRRIADVISDVRKYATDPGIEDDYEFDLFTWDVPKQAKKPA